jgi:hypothetical protein
MKSTCIRVHGWDGHSHGWLLDFGGDFNVSAQLAHFLAISSTFFVDVWPPTVTSGQSFHLGHAKMTSM